MLDNKETLMKYCEDVVDRLIMQYKEYVFLNDHIKKLENDKFAELLKKKDSDKLQTIDDKLSLIKIDLDQVSNEMTFANPIIWMMYKYKAYKDTSSEISTLGDFRKHCEPDGYICTERYKFLCKYLKDNYEKDIEDKSIYSDRIDLSDFYIQDFLVKLSQDTKFMNLWKRNEYLISRNKVNKWHTQSK